MLDRSADSHCRSSVGAGAFAAYCDKASGRWKGTVIIAARGRRARTVHGFARLRGDALRVGQRLTLRGGPPSDRAQLALVYEHGGTLDYVRFARFRSARRTQATVTSWVTRGGELVVRMRTGHRRLAPVVKQTLSRRTSAGAPAATTQATAGTDPSAMQPPATEAECSVSRPADPLSDQRFDALFTRCGAGWTGGDATYSVALPDGRVAWIFGDSFVGGVRADGSRDPGSSFVRNSMVVQAGDHLTTVTGGTAEHPQSLVTPAQAGTWYWPGDATVEGGHLRVFLSRFEATGPGAWDFALAGTDVASFSLPDLRLEGVTPISGDHSTSWGVAILEDGAYTYVYGVEDSAGEKYAHVARAPSGGLLGPWEHFTGSGWSLDASASARVLAGVSNQFGVIKVDQHYVLLSQEHSFGRDIAAWSANDPAGPWGSRTVVYSTPDLGAGLYAYNALPHPEWTADDRLLLSYNVNAFDSARLFADADAYRPRFVRVPLETLPG